MLESGISLHMPKLGRATDIQSLGNPSEKDICMGDLSKPQVKFRDSLDLT